jgi:hypothetical protein
MAGVCLGLGGKALWDLLNKLWPKRSTDRPAFLPSNGKVEPVPTHLHTNPPAIGIIFNKAVLDFSKAVEEFKKAWSKVNGVDIPPEENPVPENKDSDMVAVNVIMPRGVCKAAFNPDTTIRRTLICRECEPEHGGSCVLVFGGDFEPMNCPYSYAPSKVIWEEV